MMQQQSFSWELFNKIPAVGIVRNMRFDDMVEVLPVYVEAGLNTIEITMNTPRASEMIRYAADNYGGKLNVGAGTVCNEEELKAALSCGAQFIVAPIVKRQVITSCVDKKVPVFPGAYTPTEIYEAWQLGAAMVKVFPANNLGPSYISNVKAPLNQVKLMPTGGVDLHNITEFFKAGADAVGIGGNLFHKAFINSKDWAALKSHFKTYVDTLGAMQTSR